MSLKTIIKKSFDKLTNDELYDILDLRYTVFMMEQKIIYVDTDYKDQKCLHYFIKNDDGKIVSYLRLIPKGLKYDEYSMGRVVTDADFRKKGLASKLIEEAKKDIKGEAIRISAQAYLESYYKKLGFYTVSETYIEEGIPHIEMLCDNK